MAKQKHRFHDIFRTEQVHLALIMGLCFVAISQLAEWGIDRHPNRLLTAVVVFVLLMAELNVYVKIRDGADFIALSREKDDRRRRYE